MSDPIVVPVSLTVSIDPSVLPAGPQGPAGAVGQQGPQGDVGPQGDPGVAGEPGTSAQSLVWVDDQSGIVISPFMGFTPNGDALVISSDGVVWVLPGRVKKLFPPQPVNCHRQNVLG